MHRFVAKDLEAWKHSKNRKPLLVQGARQVGKTWSILDFGHASFEEVAYVNFFENGEMKTVFAGDLDPKRLLDAIALQTGVTPQPQKTLVVLDGDPGSARELSPPSSRLPSAVRKRPSSQRGRCSASRFTVERRSPSAR